MTEFQLHDRVQFSTLHVIPVTGSDVMTDGTTDEVHGEVTRAMWGPARNPYCTVRTDDGRTFTRLAAELTPEPGNVPWHSANPDGIAVQHYTPDSVNPYPLCGFIEDGESMVSGEEAVTCHDCLAAMGGE